MFEEHTQQAGSPFPYTVEADMNINESAAPSTPPSRPVLPVEDPDSSWRVLNKSQSFVSVPTREVSAATSSIGSAPSPPSFVRIACISDTHGKHRSITIPKCDVLVHGGDFTNTGEPEQVEDLSQWFAELKRNGTVRDAIICIAGNHDLTFQPKHYERCWRKFHVKPLDDARARRGIGNCTYLEDEACTVNGISFYGSPWQPEFYGWAFNLPRSEIHKVWSRIPATTDVLVTHGPPLGRGDRCEPHGNRAGCVDLLREVQNRMKPPRLHIFGHIHEGYGVTYDGKTMFVNASSVTQGYSPDNPCIVIDLPCDLNESPALVLPGGCNMTDRELLHWLGERDYDSILPYFERAQPRLEGKDVIVPDGVSYEDIFRRLKIQPRGYAAEAVRRALTRLRSELYSRSN